MSNLVKNTLTVIAAILTTAVVSFVTRHFDSHTLSFIAGGACGVLNLLIIRCIFE